LPADDTDDADPYPGLNICVDPRDRRGKIGCVNQ
jgi:hypothetical protein